MRFRSAGRLDPSHVGRRVTVRRRLDDGMSTDTVGTLDAIDEHMVRVRRDDGEMVTIPVDAIVAARVIVPPRRGNR